MIYSYTVTTQSLATNDTVKFNVDGIKTGLTVLHIPGSAVFQLDRSGFYYVSVNAIAAATEAATDPIILQLYNGATAIPGATASELSEANTDIVDLSIDTIIQVKSSCCMNDNDVYLSLVNTGVGADITSVSITITKIA